MYFLCICSTDIKICCNNGIARGTDNRKPVFVLEFNNKRKNVWNIAGTVYVFLLTDLIIVPKNECENFGICFFFQLSHSFSDMCIIDFDIRLNARKKIAAYITFRSKSTWKEIGLCHYVHILWKSKTKNKVYNIESMVQKSNKASFYWKCVLHNLIWQTQDEWYDAIIAGLLLYIIRICLSYCCNCSVSEWVCLCISFDIKKYSYKNSLN